MRQGLAKKPLKANFNYPYSCRSTWPRWSRTLWVWPTTLSRSLAEKQPQNEPDTGSVPSVRQRVQTLTSDRLPVTWLACVKWWRGTMLTQTRRCSYRTSRVWQTMSEKHRYIRTCVYECVGVALCVVWAGGGEVKGVHFDPYESVVWMNSSCRNQISDKYFIAALCFHNGIIFDFYPGLPHI